MKKSSLFTKQFLLILLGSAVVAILAVSILFPSIMKSGIQTQTQTVAVKSIGSDIVASGTVHSQNEATLHFQTGGKLIYVPFKEGDSVSVGQTIAQLDTYMLQQELTQALNNYRSTRDTFDQTQANSQTGVLQSGQKSPLTPYNQNSLGGDQQYTAINDAAKRILDQNQANLDNSVINVQLANYALELSSLTAPFSGIITHEDVNVPGQNITPVTSFAIADPNSLVFRADVDASSIDYVSVGAQATVSISGQPTTIPATVIKIYPQKQTLPSGQVVYEVDLQSPTVQSTTKLGQDGSVVIKSSAQSQAVVVPTWTILGHKYIWVLNNNKMELRTVIIGTVHNDQTEILSGLIPGDVVITSPQTIAAHAYQLL